MIQRLHAFMLLVDCNLTFVVKFALIWGKRRGKMCAREVRKA